MDETSQRRMERAQRIAEQMQAIARFDAPPPAEAGDWVQSFYDEEDSEGRIVARGRSRWDRKDLTDEWQRLRFFTWKDEP